jgi:hypothetical protein
MEINKNSISLEDNSKLPIVMELLVLFSVKNQYQDDIISFKKKTNAR